MRSRVLWLIWAVTLSTCDDRAHGDCDSENDNDDDDDDPAHDDFDDDDDDKSPNAKPITVLLYRLLILRACRQHIKHPFWLSLSAFFLY